MSTQSEPEKKTKSTEENAMVNTLSKFYSHHILLIWLMIILIPIIIITVGCLIFPEIFYDEFIWKYFWGTIEADAKEQSYGEVTEAYNPVNTIIYAFIVIIVLFWIYKLFKRYEINIDVKFIFAIIIFIFVGGAARALEDAELFYSPTVYFFIAPIIYIVIGILVLGLILLGVAISRLSYKIGMQKAFLLVAGVFVGLDIIYIFEYAFLNDQFSYILNPIFPVIISIIILFGFLKYTNIKNRFESSVFLFSVGFWFLLICIIVLYQWQTISNWTDAYYTANPNETIELQPFAFLLVIGLTSFGVAIVYLTSKLLIPKYPKLIPFILGTNLMLFFGHFLDASATFVAIDFYGYVEKHVLPVFLIEVFHTAAIMFLLKAIIIILVIYFIDILYKKDFQANPILTGLVKIAILVLGLGPGTRDLLRLAIGV